MRRCWVCGVREGCGGGVWWGIGGVFSKGLMGVSVVYRRGNARAVLVSEVKSYEVRL